MKPTYILRAHIPGAGEGGKARYVTLGTLFTRDDGSPAIKLDTLPADGRWQGWVNAFPWEGRDDKPEKSKPKTAPLKDRPDIPDDDVPF